MSALGVIRNLGSETLAHTVTGPEIRISVLPGMTGNINRGFCGFSYEKNQVALPIFTGENRNLIGLFRQLGSGVLRLGGNQVDQTTWDRSGIGRTDGRIAPLDVDGVAAFARLAGWKVLYGVNLARSTPALAADEVAYASKVLGSCLSGIEIGNEPDMLVRGNYFPSSWKYNDYITRWRTFAKAILLRSPDVILAGPGTAYDLNWFKDFAVDAPSQVRLLTHHYYRANGKLPTSNVQHLVSSPDTNLLKVLSQVRDAAGAAKLPYRFAETNSYYNGGSLNVSNSYASALWVIDYLFTLATYGCQGVNFHGGGNGTGYTPIADVRGNVVGPRPVYYGSYLFTRVGDGDIHTCLCDSSGLNVTAYAVELQSGGANVMIVNKELQSFLVAIDLTGFHHVRSLHSASVTLMTNTSLSATTGTTIGGSTINVDGGIIPRESAKNAVDNGRLHCTLPPLSAVLLTLS
jgi:hypothetical protein